MTTRSKTDRIVRTSYAWQLKQDGSGWQSFLVRWWKNGEVMVEPLIPVEFDVPLCLNCLSHNILITAEVSADTGEVRPELSCEACGIRYKMLT